MRRPLPPSPRSSFGRGIPFRRRPGRRRSNGPGPSPRCRCSRISLHPEGRSVRMHSTLRRCRRAFLRKSNATGGLRTYRASGLSLKVGAVLTSDSDVGRAAAAEGPRALDPERQGKGILEALASRAKAWRRLLGTRLPGPVAARPHDDAVSAALARMGTEKILHSGQGRVRKAYIHRIHIHTFDGQPDDLALRGRVRGPARLEAARRILQRRRPTPRASPVSDGLGRRRGPEGRGVFCARHGGGPPRTHCATSQGARPLVIADTTLLVDLLRRDEAARKTTERLESDGVVLWVPTPAVFELWEGVERADRPEEEARRIDAVLGDYTVLAFERRHAARAGRLSGSLLRRGTALDPVDVQIAGMALEERLAVLTRNVKHFERIPGLEVAT